MRHAEMGMFAAAMRIGIMASLLSACMACQVKSAVDPDGDRGRIEAGSSDEMAERLAIFRAVDGAVRRRDFAALNAMANQWRTLRSRTPSGTWKLSYFYAGIAGPLPVKKVNGVCVNPVAAFADDWIRFDPRQPASYIVKAASLSNYGGCVRGEGFADRTSPEEMEGFEQGVAAARRILEQHRDVASVDPEFYVEMIRAYMGLGENKPSVQHLLEEGAAREPYYYGIYFAAVQYYLPQWYGAAGDLHRLGQFALDHTKADGSGAYARLFWVLDGFEQANRSQMDWPTVVRGMQDVLRKYPGDWNAANFARLSCRMGDYRAAALFIRQLGADTAPHGYDESEWRLCLGSAG